MKILIIGDSNVCTHVFKSDESATRFLSNEVTLIRPTVITSYKDALEDVDSETKVVIVSHLLNQISDLENRWKSGNIDDEKMKEIEMTVVKMAEVINTSALKHSNTKFLVVPPLIRTYPDWLFKVMNDVTKTYAASLIPAISLLPEPPVDEGDLVADGVHLKPMAQQRMRNYFLEQIQLVTEQDGNSIGKEIAEVNRSERKRKRSTLEEESTDESLTGEEVARALLKEIKKLRMDMKDRKDETDRDFAKVNESIDQANTKINNNLVATARIKEEVDELKNMAKRKTIVLRNVKMPVNFTLPRAMPDRSNSVREMLLDQIAKLPAIRKEDVTISSIFMFGSGGSLTTLQDLTMTWASNEDAAEAKFRILKAREEKLGIWSECDVSNDAVKATRVRVVLLVAIARELRQEGLEASVNRYIDSPNLVIKKDGKTVKNRTFVDAILEYGHKLSPNDVAKARHVAGQSFKGQLEQFFLVIKETGQNNEIPVPAGSYSGGPTQAGRGRGGARGRGGGRGKGERGGRGGGGSGNFSTKGRAYNEVVSGSNKK